jgi:hypothetical protein
VRDGVVLAGEQVGQRNGVRVPRRKVFGRHGWRIIGDAEGMAALSDAGIACDQYPLPPILQCGGCVEESALDRRASPPPDQSAVAIVVLFDVGAADEGELSSWWEFEGVAAQPSAMVAAHEVIVSSVHPHGAGGAGSDRASVQAGRVPAEVDTVPMRSGNRCRVDVLRSSGSALTGWRSGRPGITDEREVQVPERYCAPGRRVGGVERLHFQRIGDGALPALQNLAGGGVLDRLVLEPE